MEAPNKIYIRTGMSGLFYGSKEKSFESDIEYIRKDLLLEWAKDKKAELLGNEELTDVAAGINMGMDMLIHKINSL